MLILHLEAKNPESKLFRAYSIVCNQDLFGAWIVQTIFGKIGAKGTAKNYSFLDLEQAEIFIKKTLKKRSNATSRIGRPYKMKNCYTDAESPLSLALLDT